MCENSVPDFAQTFNDTAAGTTDVFPVELFQNAGKVCECRIYWAFDAGLVPGCMLSRMARQTMEPRRQGRMHVLEHRGKFLSLCHYALQG